MSVESAESVKPDETTNMVVVKSNNDPFTSKLYNNRFYIMLSVGASVGLGALYYFYKSKK